MVTIEVARAAKRALAQELARDPRVNGVGLGGTKAGYVIKVQLVGDAEMPELPREIDGVPVQTVVVGRITPLSNARSA